MVVGASLAIVSDGYYLKMSISETVAPTHIYVSDDYRSGRYMIVLKKLAATFTHGSRISLISDKFNIKLCLGRSSKVRYVHRRYELGRRNKDRSEKASFCENVGRCDPVAGVPGCCDMVKLLALTD